MKYVVLVVAVFAFFAKCPAELPGGLTDITNHLDSDAKEGKDKLFKYLEAKASPDPKSYNVSVELSDLKVYKQVVEGVLYHYKYSKEITVIKCNKGAKCDPKNEGTTTHDDKACEATYWVFNGKKEFKDPVCK